MKKSLHRKIKKHKKIKSPKLFPELELLLEPALIIGEN